MTVKARRQSDNQGHPCSSGMVRQPRPPGQGHRHGNVAYYVGRRALEVRLRPNLLKQLRVEELNCARMASTLPRLSVLP